MRNFEDSSGTVWAATAAETPGADYKGRWHMVVRRADAAGPELELRNVRWNNEGTARRTLDTMSVVELRRRLRSALGRAAVPAAA
jgi:hypothetical protein